MDPLGQKRLNAVLTIASYGAGGSAAAVAPTPGGEIPKQVILTASDILMYASIWKIYFEEDLSHKALLEMLQEIGLVVIAATGTAFLVAKVSTALLKEVTNWLGPLGWGVSAAIAGSLSGLGGAIWMMYCDRHYLEMQPTASDTANQ